MPFQQTLDSVHLITAQPLRYLRAWCMQDPRNVSTGSPGHAKYDGVQPLRYAICTIPLSLLSEPGNLGK